jgi:formylglycine-generating enzyme required for sulfatase activity
MRAATLIAVALLSGCPLGQPKQPSRSERAAPAPPASPEPEAIHADPQPTELVRIPAGRYRSFFPGKDEPDQVAVGAFQLEVHAVTRAQFLRFALANPKWRRSTVKRLFADEKYLKDWASDIDHGEGMADRPVTDVSWFAARAYARWLGRRLPTLQEWEYVAAASETVADAGGEEGYNQRILDWYSVSTPAVLAPVRSTPKNYFGVHDMHGLIWEWVENFNTALVTGESRGDTALERTLFCGGGSIGSADPADYAAFMRFAFRSSLEAAYTVKNLGFRCATAGDEK